MKAVTAPFLLLLFLASFSLTSAQEVDDVTYKLTNTKIDSLMGEAIGAIQSLEYNKSIAYLNSARDLAKTIENKNRIGLTSSNLSRLYLQLNDFEKATIENNKAIAVQNEKDTPLGLGQSYIIAAQLHLIKNELQDAAVKLDKAERLFTDERNRDLIAVAQFYKGKLALLRKNPGEAIILLDKAIPRLENNTEPHLLAQAYSERAKALIALKQTDEAKINLDSASELAAKQGYKNLQTEILKIASALSIAKGDFEKGYALLEDYNSRTQNPVVTQSSEVEAMSEVDRATLSNQLEKDIKLEQERAVQINQLTTVLGIALITILSLLTLSLYKNNNLRAKANELLQAKNTELIVAKENAEKASMVKAQFLSTITHELRTPMYAVTGLTHLLLTENPTPEQKKHLDSLKFSGEYLLSLINNILDLNKLEANKVEVEETSFNLKKRIKDVLFALGKSAKDKGNKLEFEFDEDIPTEILGDPLMISQILINLIGNAVKFTRDGMVTVRVQKVSQSDTDIHLHFEIEDTGEGISKKKQKNIFQNFTQGSVAINRKFGGTGLGLSIVKNLLDLLNSKISLDSTLGKGSTFKFDIKYNLNPANASLEKTEKIIESIDYESLKNRKVLVVEDNKINQMITRKILEKNNINCEVADNGEIAVEKARTESFDLILMDIHMPGISGIEATEQIRLFDTEIPILALTAVTIDENIDDFYEAGFNDIIPKPYKIEVFFQKIHNALKRSKVIS
ncbi:response regulator [Dokdonia sinensis]|uniref:histidine kinase n=1 Tax=Dokdonia sinensis TaxID=2479847 RepID=A0A3M0GQC9_9FLAO|nr:response regulator [Dokdonia sinensis]RMB63903.1 response regulator [Dokdonia sinensis]